MIILDYMPGCNVHTLSTFDKRGVCCKERDHEGKGLITFIRYVSLKIYLENQ